MRNIATTFPSGCKICSCLALAFVLLVVFGASTPDSAAQMLRPNRLQADRSGWGNPASVDAQINDWPYSKSGSQSEPSRSIPVDRFPDQSTRNEIGLASYQQEAHQEDQQEFDSELPVDAPVRTAAVTPPPRDAITNPFSNRVEQRVDQTWPAALPQDLEQSADVDPAPSTVVHSGFFSIAGEGKSGPVASSEPLPTSSEAPSFDFSALNQVFSGEDSALPRTGLGSSIQAMLLLATLSLAPAIVLMTTSYVRVVVVLSLLRQAFGSQQLPPTQVITALSLFLTMLVMAPVWNEVKTEAIDPYASEGSELSWQEAWDAGVKPVRSFMQKQIQLAGNEQSIATFYNYLPETSQQPPSSFDDVPLNVLLPAFMVSELKVAFLLGFQVFLPFLVLDLVVSSVTVSMGMLMLPPNMVSFPLKLILFVMVDGWNLVIGMLLQSFGPFV